jgi:hypothetical protein
MAATKDNKSGKMSREEVAKLGGQAYHEKRGAHGSDSNTQNQGSSSNKSNTNQ